MGDSRGRKGQPKVKDRGAGVFDELLQQETGGDGWRPCFRVRRTASCGRHLGAKARLHEKEVPRILCIQGLNLSQ